MTGILERSESVAHSEWFQAVGATFLAEPTSAAMDPIDIAGYALFQVARRSVVLIGFVASSPPADEDAWQG